MLFHIKMVQYWRYPHFRSFPSPTIALRSQNIIKWVSMGSPDIDWATDDDANVATGSQETHPYYWLVHDKLASPAFTGHWISLPGASCRISSRTHQSSCPWQTTENVVSARSKRNTWDTNHLECGNWNPLPYGRIRYQIRSGANWFQVSRVTFKDATNRMWHGWMSNGQICSQNRRPYTVHP